jgi:SAM-dependent methyltransferase
LRNNLNDKKIIDLGCNNRKLIGTENIIRVDLIKSAPDIIEADFNKPPLPFSDSFADEIHCYHVLEHLKEPALFLEEINRISKPNAKILIAVPHYSSPVAYGDPTHLHQFSLLYFYYYGEMFNFKKIFSVKNAFFTIIPTALMRYQDQKRPSFKKMILAKLIEFIPNRLPPLIADRLGGYFGGYHEVWVELINIKERS